MGSSKEPRLVFGFPLLFPAPQLTCFQGLSHHPVWLCVSSNWNDPFSQQAAFLRLKCNVIYTLQTTFLLPGSCWWLPLSPLKSTSQSGGLPIWRILSETSHAPLIWLSNRQKSQSVWRRVRATWSQIKDSFAPVGREALRSHFKMGQKPCEKPQPEAPASLLYLSIFSKLLTHLGHTTKARRPSGQLYKQYQ